MSTLNQLIHKKHKRKEIKHKTKFTVLSYNPQRKGQCIKVFSKKPKKPNSAVRKIIKVRIDDKYVIDCYVPGEGHTILENNSVLIRGGRLQDVPGMKYKVIRGKYDVSFVNRKSSRSKYGCPKRME